MKILQLSPKLPFPPKDGGAIATLNLAKAYANLGHEMTILAINTSKHYFNPLNIPQDLKEKIKFETVEIDTTIKASKMFANLFFSRTPYIADRFFHPNFTAKLISLLTANNYDIIQFEGLYIGKYLSVVNKYKNKANTVLRAHNIEHEIWFRSAKSETNLFKRFYFNSLARRIKRMQQKIQNSFDLILPISSKDAENLKKLGCVKPMHTAVFGIEKEFIKEKVKINNSPTLFFIGSLDWRPNQEGLEWFLDNVWQQLSANHLNTSFIIAGRNAPEWLVKKFNQNHVTFLGEIDEAHPFINKNDIMIAPLFSGSGMRVKIVEGMAMGKTVITTDIGAEGIPANHKKDIFIANTKELFLKHLDYLLSNPKELSNIGNNAILLIKEKFDNLAVAKGVLDFYELYRH